MGSVGARLKTPTQGKNLSTVLQEINTRQSAPQHIADNEYRII